MISVKGAHFIYIHISALDAQMSKCEKIAYTPVAWIYIVHFRFLFDLFLLNIPMQLWHVTKRDNAEVFSEGSIYHVIYVIIMDIMFLYAFIGLDALGDDIEMPFGTGHSDLPMEEYVGVLSQTIQIMSYHFYSDFPDLDKELIRGDEYDTYDQTKKLD